MGGYNMKDNIKHGKCLVLMKDQDGENYKKRQHSRIKKMTTCTNKDVIKCAVAV